jgi:hypothetical protein
MQFLLALLCFIDCPSQYDATPFPAHYFSNFLNIQAYGIVGGISPIVRFKPEFDNPRYIKAVEHVEKNGIKVILEIPGVYPGLIRRPGPKATDRS